MNIDVGQLPFGLARLIDANKRGLIHRFLLTESAECRKARFATNEPQCTLENTFVAKSRTLDVAPRLPDRQVQPIRRPPHYAGLGRPLCLAMPPIQPFSLDPTDAAAPTDVTVTANALAADDMQVVAHLTLLALAAGDEIMRQFPLRTPASCKTDGSPVTPADVAAEAIILQGLQRHFASIACVAEEAMAAGDGPRELGRTFFLVDALDGTREFLASRDEFTVNIALVRDCMPAVGVVYAPARHSLYVGAAALQRALRFIGTDACARAAAVAAAMTATSATFSSAETAAASGRGTAPGGFAGTPMAVRAAPTPPSIVVSRSRSSEETQAFIVRHPDARVEPMGSSLKFCAIASGEADFYPCFGRTMEWDTAAGHAVLMAAGGRVTLQNGHELGYGKRHREDADYANPAFIASA